MTRMNIQLAEWFQRLLLLAVVVTSLNRCGGATNRIGDVIVAVPTNTVSTLGLYDEYEPTFWDIREGLPHNRVTAMYFDHQGYLWLGSLFGITRFNGEDFVAFDPYNTPSLRSDSVNGIIADDETHFWVATDKGLYRCNGRDFSEIELPGGYDNIRSITKTKDGALWLAATKGLIKYAEGKAVVYGEKQGLTQDLLQSIRVYGGKQLLVFGYPRSQLFNPDLERFEDLPWGTELTRTLEPVSGGLILDKATGDVWYHNKEGVGRFKDTGDFKDPDDVELVVKKLGGNSYSVRLLELDHAGAVWTSRIDGVVTRHVGDQETSINLNNRYGVALVDTFLQHNEDYWLGAEEGLVLLKKRKVKNYSVLNGLPSYYVMSIAQLDDNLFLVGTGNGPAIIDRTRQTTTAVRVNVANEGIRSVCVAPEGGFWISNEHLGPLLIDKNYEVHYSPAHPIWGALKNDEHLRVYAMMYDSHGNFWIGTERGAIKIEPDGTYFFYHASSDPPMPGSDIRMIYEHTDGSIWMGSEGDGMMILKDGKFQHYTASEGLSGNEVFSFACDPDGKTVWAATDNGVTRIRDGQLRALDHRRGVPSGTLNQILIDANRDAWITSLRGIHRCSIHDLNAAVEDDSLRVSMMTVDSNDGMLNAETNGEQQPAGIIDRQGNLWIPTIKAVSTFHPTLFTDLQPPAPPLIEQITLDGKTIYNNTINEPGFLSEKLVIRPDEGDLLEIELAAPAVRLTDTAHYQAKLGGDDGSTWRDMKGPRSIYTTLKPGRYAFQARVASPKNKWSAPILAFQIERLPYFYQTWAFYLVVGVSIVGAGLLLHARRMRVVSRIQHLEQKDALITERERIARDMHDDLGSRLTHISLIAEISEQENRHLTREQTRELNLAARQAARAVEEIVWAAKPDNDNSDNTISFLIQYAEHQLAAAEIACRNNSGIDLPEAYLSPEHRHAVFLAFKEAINNIIKHSNATEVKLSITRVQEKFTFRISDNGDGFDPKNVSTGNGNGLRNMVSRMADIDGRCSFQSAPNSGTVVRIVFHASKKNESGFHRK